MKTRVWIEQEITVDISSDDVIEALSEFDPPDLLPAALSIISHCVGIIKRIPPALIAEMSDGHRGIIVAALEEQAARYGMHGTLDKQT